MLNKFLNPQVHGLGAAQALRCYGAQKKFFPGRQVQFVKVANIERAVIADEVKTRTETFPLKVVQARKEDFGPIVDFILDDFVKEEPICRSLGATPAELRPLFEDLASECISSNMTLMALDAANNIICSQSARRLDFSNIQRIENYKLELKADYGDDIDHGKYPNRKCNQYDCITDVLYPMLPHVIPDAMMAVDILFASVHPALTNKGVGRFVALKVMELAKSKGFTHAGSIPTSKYSVKMALSAGYTKAASVKFSEFKDHGKQVFKEMPDGTEATLVYKKL